MKFKNKAKNPTHAIFGVATDGTIINAPISTFPHALVAGATGSGKSVFINSALISMMAIAHPDEVKLIIIDPKGNEFGNYKGLPHMLTDPIIDLSQSKNALEYLANEMDYRLQLFRKYGGKKKIDAFNDAIDNGEIKGVEKLPYIVLMIDELADLMSQYKDDVQGSIKRLGAKARAAGVHMILATQTPRREFIDGAIKANVPTKFVLMVANYTDSLVALGDSGAEELKPHGDFYASISGGKLQRGQAPLVEDDEIKDIFDELKASYPEPELIDIDEAVVEAQLRYQRIVAENTGKNPDDITMEDVQKEEATQKSSPKPELKSTRSEEERQKAKQQHKAMMEKLEKDEKEGNAGAKTVEIDTSKFSFEARNKRRKEKGEPELKPKSGIIPTSSSRRREQKASKKKEKANLQETSTTKETNKPKSQKTVEHQEDIKKHRKIEQNQKDNRQVKSRPRTTTTTTRKKATHTSRRRPTKTASGSPLARKR